MHKVFSAMLLTTALTPAMAEVESQITTGLFYASGQNNVIGGENLDLYSVPLSLTVDTEHFKFGVSTAYLSADNLKIGPSNSANGMGDTMLSVGWKVTQSPAWTITLKEKIATGDKAEGLSTGKDDTFLQVDYFQPLSDQTSLFANVGHKWVGKVAGLDMNDALYGSVGLGRLLQNNWRVGGSLDYYQSSFASLDDQLGVSLFTGYSLSQTTSIGAFASADNTNTHSVGLTMSYKF